MGIWDRWFKKKPSLEEVRAALEAIETQRYDPKTDFKEWMAIREGHEKTVVAGGAASVPILLEVLRREDAADGIVSVAEYRLRDIGTPGLKGLLEFIDAEQGALRARGLHALWLFRNDLPSLIPTILPHLSAADGEIRGAAMHALALSGEQCASHLPAILAGLRDPHPSVRGSAAYALENAKRPVPEARALLESLFGDADLMVRRYALGAYQDLFPNQYPSTDLLLSLLRDPNNDNAGRAVEWIEGLDPLPPTVIEALTALGQREDAVFQALELLWTKTRNASLVLPAVARLLGENFDGQLQRTCDLVSRIGPEARSAVPRLVEVLDRKDYDTLWAACDALAAIGRHAEPAIPRLTVLLGHPSGLVGSSAARALGAIGRPAFPSVLAVLKGGNAQLQEFAADALGEMGEAALEALPALRNLFEESEGNDELRAWVLLALGEIAPSETGPRISALLAEGLPSRMRARAAAVLGRLGRDARSARAELEELLDGDDPDVAAAARAALDRIS